MKTYLAVSDTGLTKPHNGFLSKHILGLSATQPVGGNESIVSDTDARGIAYPWRVDTCAG